MKFRDIVLYDFLVDKKPFKPYIKRDIKNYYILIEFTEKDCAEIYNNYSKVMKMYRFITDDIGYEML